ncbi:MAG: BamA/TamA family outer membrane protein [Flavobacteriales bacterium]|nr:BamA/TamA family outer membrane protein [Flavobacteriales bacterium]
MGEHQLQQPNRNHGTVRFAVGNSNYMPYIKQYYAGGMNSLRPFAPRIIGPGTYLPVEDNLNSVNNITQSGDIVIEGNIEYRFPIVYKLKGALWSDYGNIYLREPDPLRPGGAFEFDTFLDKMVVTGGFGLRLDLDYFVIRWDVGFTHYYP